MVEFLKDYGLFFLKTGTIVFAIIFIVSGLVNAIRRGRMPDHWRLDINKLNEHYEQLRDAIMHEMLPRGARKKARKEWKKQRKKEEKKADMDDGKKRKKIFVLEFKGDLRASAISALREEVTAVLTIAEKKDEVVVRLECSGGMVHAYGLAASQLQRIKERKIPLTITVDKVAASGGYLMASVADKLLAAPFAVLGSIGVASEVPNFYRLLKKHDIDFEQITAGEYKRTLTMFGKNTEKGRQKVAEQLKETHALFKSFIKENRPSLDVDSVATGEYWYGRRALELSLVDELRTSDDYLLEASKDADIYMIKYKPKESLPRRIAHEFEESLQSFLASIWKRAADGPFA